MKMPQTETSFTINHDKKTAVVYFWKINKKTGAYVRREYTIQANGASAKRFAAMINKMRYCDWSKAYVLQ